MEMQNQIRQVWRYNVELEFCLIREMARKAKFVSFDTEFPGIIFKPATHPRVLSPEKRYALMKADINSLNLDQLGLTLSHSSECRSGSVTWEFNFCSFDLLHDPCVLDSVQLLHCQGIDFFRNLVWGIDTRHFARLLWSSGLICNDSRICWVTFHGATDFGYLIKVLTQSRLPDSIDEFGKLVRWYFGSKVMDIKYLMRFCDNLYGGLEKVGVLLNMQRRIGQSLQAGSDSLLTWQVYQRVRSNFFESWWWN